MWEHSEELKELAKKITAIRDEVVHVDINEVLFVKEYGLKPRAMASCHKIDKHPIQVFTDCLHPNMTVQEGLHDTRARGGSHSCY